MPLPRLSLISAVPRAVWLFGPFVALVVTVFVMTGWRNLPQNYRYPLGIFLPWFSELSRLPEVIVVWP